MKQILPIEQRRLKLLEEKTFEEDRVRDLQCFIA